ncbi:MAG: PilT/PilU family type 4a pilus ATPase [Polyangiaceae bacterium]
MVSLKSLLANLEPKRTSRVELVSGRRPRLVLDAGKEKGDFKNLADEAITDEEVIAICESAGGRKHVEALDDRGATWVHVHDGNPIHVRVEMRGREIAAIFTANAGRPETADRTAAALQDRTPSRRVSQSKQPQQRRTMQDIRAPQRQKTVPPERRRTVPPTSNRKPTPAELKPTLQSRKSAPPPRKTTPSPPNRDRPTQGGIPRAPAPPHVEREQTLARIHVEPVIAPNSAKIGEKVRKLARLAWGVDHASASRLEPLLDEGRDAGASDLHLTADVGEGARRGALLRVAGSLIEARTRVPSSEREAAILALVPLAYRGALETRGGADFALDVPRAGRFRVNVTLTLCGLKASLRFIPRELPTIASLGLPDALRAATEQHQGLIVVTGPAGHGKTTTLAALVDHVNATRPHHVITVEDPIEIVHPIKTAILTQREVGAQTRSFARALKGALRQDPDVIVVGELRDVETMRMALSASETGHLVIATMNTPSAAHTIDALIDFFPPGDQPQVRSTLAGGLKYIVSQRLVPRADGKGCVAAVETLPGSLPLWNMIRDQKTFQLPSHMQRGKGAGIVRLNDSLADLVQRGVITLEDAMRSSTNAEELQLILNGPASSPVELPPSRELPGEKMVGQLLGRAGAFFSRKGGGG